MMSGCQGLMPHRLGENPVPFEPPRLCADLQVVAMNGGDSKTTCSPPPFPPFLCSEIICKFS